ncbi:helix-turn-helix domain-containing protein [Nonomuraea sp. NPDC050790]|uniref:helix-turn-helix domain-containing protein n=1 Tax=Nonomuraea sp. NPDC050790 TaxID=3364371 RepID=UPI003791BE4D
MGESAGREPGVTPNTYVLGSGSTVLRIQLGSQLRRLRLDRGITADAAAYAIRGSQSKISRMESGRIGLKERDVADLLTLYAVTDSGTRETLLAMTRQSNVPSWWHRFADAIPHWFQPYLGLEEAAHLIRGYEPLDIPDLLMTREYAAGLLPPDLPEEARQRRIDYHVRRRQLLDGAEPPRLWFVIDEAVLLRPIGGPEVMRAQLRHLLEVSKSPEVCVQILPFTTPRDVSEPFSILRFSDVELPDAVFVEHLNQGAFLERRVDLDAYTNAFERLIATAHTPEDSKRVILAAMPR